MDYKKKIEIPFGAFDSELIRQEISIPNGFKAVIDGNKIILTRAESADEKIRKEIVDFIDINTIGSDERRNRWFSYLENQGESYTKRDVDNAYLEGMAFAKNELEKQAEVVSDKDDIEAEEKGIRKAFNKIWEEKQGEQKPTQEIEPFEAEHGKYYYCIKDYFCGGRKQASKGDVVQALRGLPIMGLKDAGEYFLPVNSIKCNSAWSEEDEKEYKYVLKFVDNILNNCGNKKDYEHCKRCYDWLKSLRPQNRWKPSDEQMEALWNTLHPDDPYYVNLSSLYNDLKKLREDKL